MKKILIFLIGIFLMSSCKPSAIEKEGKEKGVISKVATVITYPEDLDKVFAHHGTVDRWKKMHSMSYEIVKDEGNEKQMIDLHSRAERIEGINFTSGFDGNKYWVEADTSYKGNAKFYTNLMFYFYAMPFVLADDGINYDKVDPLVFDGKEYPGYRISYGDGVGISPQDEYFIHYDPETYEMQWLGYTVTYFSGEKGDKTSWIRYNDWKDFNGLKLPNSLSWYKSEEGKITELRNTRNFVNVTVAENPFPEETLKMPTGAREVE